MTDEIFLSRHITLTTEEEFRNFHTVIQECSDAQDIKPQDYVQIKVNNNQVFVNCPGSQMNIDGKNKSCLDGVFQLPLITNFYVGNAYFNGTLMKMVGMTDEKIKENHLINWHLGVPFNESRLTQEFTQPILGETLRKGVIAQHMEKTSSKLSWLLAGIIIAFVAAVVNSVINFKYLLKRTMLRVRVRMHKDNDEEDLVVDQGDTLSLAMISNPEAV